MMSGTVKPKPLPQPSAPPLPQRLFDLFVDAFGEHAEGLHSGFVFVIQWCQSKRRLSAQGLALQTDRC